MQISSTSTTYGGDAAQRLLARLFDRQGPPAGQDLPGDSAAPAANPPAAPTPPANPPGPAQFAQATLASLLDTQQQKPTGADVAQKVISAVDADGDGALRLDEVEKALGQDSASGADGLSQAFAKLDANGDGKLSQDELASAIDARHASGAHHHHRHAHNAQASDGQLASALLGQADANGDGALSADEIAGARGTSAGDGLRQTLAGFDKDGDGQLDSGELAAAIAAFRTAHGQAAAGSAQALSA